MESRSFWKPGDRLYSKADKPGVIAAIGDAPHLPGG